jgi:hypothetical protein
MADYRPDVWGQVEGSWRTKPPPQNIIDQALATECPDCNVNVFIEEHPEVDGLFIIKSAHDDSCPWLKRFEESQGIR